ncbi:MAG: LamG-like jellyroll fold domain-containing protein, partial [Verrucomicrobiota bacterium]
MNGWTDFEIHSIDFYNLSEFGSDYANSFANLLHKNPPSGVTFPTGLVVDLSVDGDKITAAPDAISTTGATASNGAIPCSDSGFTITNSNEAIVDWTNGLTAEMWVEVTNPTESFDFVSCGSQFAITASQSQGIVANWADNNNNTAADGAPNVPQSFFHLAFTLANKTSGASPAKVYLNGDQVVSTQFGNLIQNFGMSDLKIGAGMAGSVATFQLYNQVRTPSQIKTDMMRWPKADLYLHKSHCQLQLKEDDGVLEFVTSSGATVALPDGVTAKGAIATVASDAKVTLPPNEAISFAAKNVLIQTWVKCQTTWVPGVKLLDPWPSDDGWHMGASRDLDAGVWYHVAEVYTATDYFYFLNGKKTTNQDSLTWETKLETSTELTLGASQSYSGIRIYNLLPAGTSETDYSAVTQLIYSDMMEDALAINLVPFLQLQLEESDGTSKLTGPACSVPLTDPRLSVHAGVITATGSSSLVIVSSNTGSPEISGANGWLLEAWCKGPFEKDGLAFEFQGKVDGVAKSWKVSRDQASDRPGWRHYALAVNAEGDSQVYIDGMPFGPVVSGSTSTGDFTPSGLALAGGVSIVGIRVYNAIPGGASSSLTSDELGAFIQSTMIEDAKSAGIQWGLQLEVSVVAGVLSANGDPIHPKNASAGKVIGNGLHLYGRSGVAVPDLSSKVNWAKGFSIELWVALEEIVNCGLIQFIGPVA